MLKRECGRNSEKSLEMCYAEIKSHIFRTIIYETLRHNIKFVISRKDSNRVIFIDYYVEYKYIRSGETTMRNYIVEDIVRILKINLKMSLDECLIKKEIIEEFNELSIIYYGKTYKFKVGDVYNKLTIVKIVSYREPKKARRKGCICKCSCGEYVGPFKLLDLLNGDHKSCGCYSRKIHSEYLKKRNYKHGDSFRNKRNHLYTLWAAMKDRATNHNRKDSKYYSDKGNFICEEWKNSYEDFKTWSLNNGYKEELSIDRIDNDKGYCPDNCRWIPLSRQNSNKTSNRFITHNGITKTLTDWIRDKNLERGKVEYKLYRTKEDINKILGFEDDD